MDTRAVVETAGIDAGRLNMWIQQDLIPGMSPGARGRQRQFDLKTATHVMIMAELTQLGVMASIASLIAAYALRQDAEMLIVTQPYTEQDPERPGVAQTNVRTAFLKSADTLQADLASLRKAAFKEKRPPPTIFVLVDIKALATRMDEAHEAWRRSREQAETESERRGDTVTTPPSPPAQRSSRGARARPLKVAGRSLKTPKSRPKNHDRDQ
jgi:hypothetical protein